MSRILTWQIMVRYLRGKRSANAVTLLSRISMVAIGVCSCAMIILFSAFNGLGGVVKEMYVAFYSDLRIVPKKGKFFALSPEQLQSIGKVAGVQVISPTIEDNVLMNNEGKDNQVITIRGGDQNYFEVNDLKPYITEGESSLGTNGEPGAIVGKLIMDQMGMALDQGMSTITLYYPNVNNTNPSADPTSAFTTLHLVPEGVFESTPEYDSKYILAPLPLVQELLQAPGQYSALEMKVRSGADVEDIKNEVQKITGSNYIVQTRYEQNRTLYMVISAEKWAMYAILVLVLIIASFTMLAGLSLLVLEKEKDIAILKTMGLQRPAIKNIFIGEGILWTLIGGLVGITLGVLICLGQQQFAWVKMEEGWLMDAYPVEIFFPDILLILATVMLIGLLAGLYPAGKAVRARLSALRS